MQGVPFFYDYINTYNGSFSPSTSHADSALSRFFQRYLLQEAISVYEWKMPSAWSKDYFLYTLYCFGFISIIETDKYGVICQGCGLNGYDVFYRPTNAVITNPLLRGILTPRIGKQCTIIKLQPDYGGIMDLVTKYGDIMAMTMQTAGCNIEASKLAYVFAAENKASAESFKKMFDRIASGEPCVVYDKNLKLDDGSKAWEAFQQNLHEVYIASDVLSDMRKIEAMFDTDIGIPNANTDKRERLVTDEVNANNVETASKCALWLEQLQESVKKTNDMFGLNISVDWRFPDAYNMRPEGGSSDVSNNEPAGTV